MVDENLNGVSDLWEKLYNSGELITNFDPNVDPDGDGWTNEREAIAGTDPFNKTPAIGFLLPDITRFAATYGENLEGNPVLATPEGYLIHWSGEIGKQYRLFCSPDLTMGSWFPVDFPITALNPEILYGFSPSSTDGTPPPALFWKTAVNDVDTDGDGFNDYEEGLMHTDPSIADSDADGLPDFWEIAHGFDPFDDGSINPENGSASDSDLDGYSNLEEYLGGSDPGLAASIPANGVETSVSAGNPPMLISESNYVFGHKYGFDGFYDYLGIPEAHLRYLHRVTTLSSTDINNDGDGGSTTTTTDIDPASGAATINTVTTGAGGSDYGGAFIASDDTHLGGNGIALGGSGETSTYTETLSVEHTTEQLQTRVEGMFPAYTGNFSGSDFQFGIARHFRPPEPSATSYYVGKLKYKWELYKGAGQKSLSEARSLYFFALDNDYVNRHSSFRYATHFKINHRRAPRADH